MFRRVALFCFCCHFFTFAIADTDIDTGHIDRFTFQSEYLENNRTVRVYLPPEYDSETERRYPVMYLQDGQNLMTDQTDTKADVSWRINESTDNLIRTHKITPIIIVGIDYISDKRNYEYNLLVEKSLGAGEFQNQGGGGEIYGFMLLEELIPLINSKYRTKIEPEHTAVGGASFGCNISLYLALEYSDVFGNGMGMSCATWFANQWLNRFVRGLSPKPSVKIWLDVGDTEYENINWAAAEVSRHKELYASFLSKGWQEGHDIQFDVFKNDHHAESDWAVRFPQALEWFFAPPKKIKN